MLSIRRSATLLRRARPLVRTLASVRKFAKSHEWIEVDGDVGTVGITDHAQKELGDVVFVALPQVGDSFDAKASFGDVESVKATSDVYAPVRGTVVQVNETLESRPELVNESPESDGWFIKITVEDASELDSGDLLDEEQYKEFISS